MNTITVAKLAFARLYELGRNNVFQKVSVATLRSHKFCNSAARTTNSLRPDKTNVPANMGHNRF